jgi:aminoglycoside phosphotransferase
MGVGPAVRSSLRQAAWRARRSSVRAVPRDVVAMLATLPTDADAADVTFRLRRAWPQEGNLVLEYASLEGRSIPAQWMPSLRHRAYAFQQARRAKLPLPEPLPTPHGPVIVYRHGCDPLLPGLAYVREGYGGRVLRHRIWGRALLSVATTSGEPAFAKVFRSPRALRRLRAVEELVAQAGSELRVPAILEADETNRFVLTAAVEGQPVRRLLRSGRAETAIDAFAQAARALHELPARSGVDSHTGGAEAERLRLRVRAARWVWPAFGDQLAAAATSLRERLGTLDGTEDALIHRDLHAGNALMDEAGGVTFVDLDGLARGDPALDLGAVAAGMIRDSVVADGDIGRGIGAARAFLASYQPDDTTLRRAQVYLEAKLVAIAAGCAFRPKARPHSCELLRLALAPPSIADERLRPARTLSRPASRARRRGARRGQSHRSR